jgi:hypothetical protein
MNEAHLHLMINHLPIFGMVIATFILLAGILRNNTHVIRTGLVLAIVAGLAILPSNGTGEGAEDVLEQAGFAEHTYIHRHEELAETALITGLIAAAWAIVTLVSEMRGLRLTKTFRLVALVLLLGNTMLLQRVGTTGGEIRHTEIRDASNAPPAGDHDDHEHH